MAGKERARQVQDTSKDRTSWWTPAKAEQIKQGAITGTTWLLLSVVSVFLLSVLFMRERSYENVLNEALAAAEGRNVTVGQVQQGGLGASTLLDVITAVVSNPQAPNSNSTSAVHLIAELAKLRQDYIAVQEQLAQAEVDRNLHRNRANMMEVEKSAYQQNLSIANLRQSSDTEKIEKYKRSLVEKRLQRDAFMHKLKELGVDVPRAKSLIREQVSKGVGVGNSPKAGKVLSGKYKGAKQGGLHSILPPERKSPNFIRKFRKRKEAPNQKMGGTTIKSLKTTVG